MKDYDLLIAGRVVDRMLAMRKAERALLRAHFDEIRRSPGDFSDYTERDDVGRELEINLFGKHAIIFWCDAADNHVKILDLVPSDRPR
jgi:hypothetical protein